MSRGTRCRKAEAWQIPCHPILVLPFLLDFDVANARVGAERNPLKTEVIYHVNDLDAAPLEWRRAELGQNLCSHRRQHHARGRCWVSAVHPRSARARSALPGPADGVRPPPRVWVSRVVHILRVHGRKVLEEQSAAVVYDEIGQRSLERLFPSLTEDSMTQATLSASRSGIGFKRARDIAAPAHVGALIAAKRRIRGMIRDAVLTGLLPEQLLETRLSEVINVGTSTCLSALHPESRTGSGRVLATHRLGQQGPGVAGPTIASLGHGLFSGPQGPSQWTTAPGAAFATH